MHGLLVANRGWLAIGCGIQEFATATRPVNFEQALTVGSAAEEAFRPPCASLRLLGRGNEQNKIAALAGRQSIP